MGRIQRRKHNVAKNKKFHKALRTRKKRRDLDQIHTDIQKEEEVKQAVLDPDLQGGGHFYCVACARHFTSSVALTTHLKTKRHKLRLKLLKEEPYSQKEAERAAGLHTSLS